MDSSIGLEAFTSRHIGVLTGISPQMLERWEAYGVISPSLLEPEGRGTRRVFSFADLVAIRVAVDLRAIGVSLETVGRVLKRVRSRGWSSTTSLPPTFLVTDGAEVFELEADTIAAWLQHPSKPTNVVLSLHLIVEELKEAARRLRQHRAASPKPEHPRVQRAAARVRRRAA